MYYGRMGQAVQHDGVCILLTISSRHIISISHIIMISILNSQALNDYLSLTIWLQGIQLPLFVAVLHCYHMRLIGPIAFCV